MNRFSLILLVIGMIGWMVSSAHANSIPPQPASQPIIAQGDDSDSPRDEISSEQEQAMWEEIQRNLAMLRKTGVLAEPNAAQTVTYDFPLRLAPGLPDYAGFRVSAFPDHNPAIGSILDYNGGTRTYDSHQGTDYALYPFGWNKLDAGEMQVIAATAGTIVNKSNVDPTDHNPCDGGSNADPWNYIALTHADGRLTIYGHMRYNSLTSKSIGQTVAQGEYLGTAASSGNSSGAHLHFEVRYGNFANDKWTDPYAGPNSQAQSLWTNQRPYYDSAINKLSTHSAPPSSPACPPLSPNLQDSFTTPSNIYFYTYYRDYLGGLNAQFTIYRPDESVYQAWQDAPANGTFNSVMINSKAYSFTSNDPAGTWRFQANYNGQVYQTFFNVNLPTTVTVTSPNGGEQWARQVGHSLTWTDNLGGDVNIALYRNGVYSTTLASNTPSDGDYLWTPDTTLALGAGYTIRVISVINPAVYDSSNAPFILIEPKSLFLPFLQR